MSWLKDFNPFRKPSPEEIAYLELQEARRALLVAQSGQEWATSQVQYNQDRIARLSLIVKEDAGGSQTV